MRLFITGATGFLGSAFLRQASAAGHTCIALARTPTPIPSPNIQWIQGGLESPRPKDLESCDALVHFASVGVSPQPTTWDEAFDINVRQSVALLHTANQAGIPKILLCGSCFEYGRSGERYEFIPPNAPLEPVGPYAASKAAFSLAAAALARETDSSLVLLRPFHLFGDGQHPDNFWPSLKSAATQGLDFPMTPGEQIRDFLSVEDASSRFLDCLSHWPGTTGHMHIANIGSGNPVSLRDFATSWWQKWNASGSIMFGEIPYRKQEVMRFVPQLSSIHSSQSS
jgi:nucleoside-diphosphate-sugar epimerase